MSAEFQPPLGKASAEVKPRVLLLVPTTSYRVVDFLEAAERRGVEVVLGSDRCHVLEELGAVRLPFPSLVLDFNEREACVDLIRAQADRLSISAIVSLDDRTSQIAAQAGAALGLPHNDPGGARASRDKLELRRRLSSAGLIQPQFFDLSASLDPAAALDQAGSRLVLPCVLKPRALSGSRGVIRANDRAGFARAFARVAAILHEPEVAARGEESQSILIESYVEGFEVALEGLARRGEIEVLALFDKPDPLVGPFFEESLYVTPSLLDPITQANVHDTVAKAARAIGLREGPLHAELRIHAGRAVLLELAQRSIGGLCGRVLRFGANLSLEELILLHAAGEDTPPRAEGAAGVLMLPIPRSGVLQEIEGLEAAKSVPGIEGVVIRIPPGSEVRALPEGNQYLGFAFARGPAPEVVERALRQALRCLKIKVRGSLPILEKRSEGPTGPP